MCVYEREREKERERASKRNGKYGNAISTMEMLEQFIFVTLWLPSSRLETIFWIVKTQYRNTLIIIQMILRICTANVFNKMWRKKNFIFSIAWWKCENVKIINIFARKLCALIVVGSVRFDYGHKFRKKHSIFFSIASINIYHIRIELGSDVATVLLATWYLTAFINAAYLHGPNSCWIN